MTSEFGDPRDNDPADPWSISDLNDPEGTEAALERTANAEHYVALTDAAISREMLDEFLPLWQRFPEPRIFDQDKVFYRPDGTWLDLKDANPDAAGALLASLLHDAETFHAAAVRDEQYLTSTGLRKTLNAAGVPLVEDLDANTWIESTALVRSLRRKAFDG